MLQCEWSHWFKYTNLSGHSLLNLKQILIGHSNKSNEFDWMRRLREDVNLLVKDIAQQMNCLVRILCQQMKIWIGSCVFQVSLPPLS